MAFHRALRVGVLLGDKLVDERIFDGATPVTFGQSLRCALSIPVDGAPREHVLFARDQDRWILRISPAMEARIGQGDQIAIVTTAKDIALDRGARGKLRVGEATLLFQEIAARPKTPRPQLPASIRGTFADRIDRRLAVIIGGSLAVHIAIAAWAWATDREVPSMLEAPVMVMAQEPPIDINIPDAPLTPPNPTEPGVAKPVTPPSHPMVPSRPIAVPHAPDPAQLVHDADRMANLLTGGIGDHGVGGMNHRQPGVDLDKQLDEVRRTGANVTIGDSGHAGRWDDSNHVDDHRRNIGIVDQTMTNELPKHQDADLTRIKIFDIHTDVPTTLTADGVLERISTVYMAGLKRCYRKALAGDATLSGKVALSFTIDERGHVADPEATGITSEVDSCISSQMASWHFSTPKDKAGKPTEVNFQVALALQPS